jgi:hypothetical protein
VRSAVSHGAGLAEAITEPPNGLDQLVQTEWLEMLA